jgi:hypothetical protein
MRRGERGGRRGSNNDTAVVLPDLPFALSEHAAEVVREREIHLEWIAATLAKPTMTHPDEDDPEAQHALARVPAFANRVLRVVYNPNVSPLRIITVFFDRSMKDRL